MSGKYTLWLRADTPQTNEKLRKTIDTYTQKLGGPSFEPHVTLLGSIRGMEAEEAVERVKSFAKDFKPFEILLTDIKVKSIYFQCVLATPDPSHVPFLTSLNTAARAAFGHKQHGGEGGDVYFPHLSLVYGLYDQDVKEKAAAEIKAEGSVVGTRLDVKSVQVWDMEGTPEQWKVVAEVPLG
ncbi:hypothetical protein HK104_010351 [Borealophlyctis nickersoniae]|nr:hypothetical protein HK104_010351 [Borealophlyctis nickersoniae]